MSADNYEICPGCKEKQATKKKKLLDKAQKAYGKVSPEKYLEMIHDANNQPPLEYTLREDYDIGISNGEMKFTIEYRASCKICSFSFSYESTKQINNKGEVV
jgi:hypothetical protein